MRSSSEDLKWFFKECYYEEQLWGIFEPAFDRFIGWCVKNKFHLKSFENFSSYLEKNKPEEWDFVKGYQRDFERFAQDLFQSLMSLES